ncbi:glomulin-like [Venturia canescens]|uniref:glomulin-like n=1 Tax=Venturia canescens TaxID=32260 RepID=UPI001C9C0394|nr:glomulin-like [Venturia canescens]
MLNSEEEEQTSKSQLFVIKLGELLDAGLIDEAENLFEQVDAQGDLAESLWEIVPALASRLALINGINNREATATCEKFLEVLSTKCNPKETLLLLVEQLEASEDEVSFRSLLKPLGISLLRAGPERLIDWCVRSIKHYVQNLPFPENEKPLDNGGENQKEKDPTVTRLSLDYDAILSFLKPVIQQSLLSGTSNIKTKNHLLHLHLSLFGAPYCYLSEKQKKTCDTESNISMFETALSQILLLIGDFLKYHAIIDFRSRGRRKKITQDKDEEEGSTITKILRGEHNVSNLAWANYYYYVFNTHFGVNNIPHVYNYLYLMPGIFYLANVFLNQAQYILVRKGLKTTEAILSRIEEQSVGHEVLEIPVYHDLFAGLSRVMVYCDSDEDRKFALKMFHRYINIFNYRARYLVILDLYETANHSGIFSLLTSITKQSIIHCLEMKWDYFSADKLERLMKRICNLPNGAASDLVEISDEIIGALNLVRFLVLRDRHNETGIWKILENLEKNYLVPLREGIELARAHWLIKIKDLEEQNKSTCTSNNVEPPKYDVSIHVGGQILPKMPLTQKITFCVRSLWTSRALLAVQGNKENGLGKDEKPLGNENDEDYEKSIKKKILSASLNFVNEYGWSQQAISAGAESVGYPGIIHGMFPNGGAELVQHFYANCNAELNKILKAEALAIEADPSTKKKTPEAQVRDALEKRLRMVIPYKTTWPQALGLMALPPNVPTSLANLLTLVDDICYYAGDRSVDFNWYTRRVVLAGIYKTTELYLLQDSSEDHMKTWEFMERRIEDAVQINRVVSVTSDLPPPDQALSRATEAASAAFITARNILGLNWNR